MEEIKINQNKPEIKDVPKPSVKTEEKEIPLAQKVEMLWNDANNVIKRKPMKLPRKAKVRKRKAKKGWVGIVKIDENNNASGEKVLLRDSSFITRDKLFHSTDGKEMTMWDGKFPVFFQEAKKNNPKFFRFNEGENETYGQSYIMAKMLKEAIKEKKGGMNFIIWLLVIGGGIFIISKLVNGGL